VDDAPCSSIVGGEYNVISEVSSFNIIGGGTNNIITKQVECSSILGGGKNCICSNSDYSTLVGGKNNIIQSSSRGSFIGGGASQAIGGGSNGSFIGSGSKNMICSSNAGVILNGNSNTICEANYNSIANGFGNCIDNTSSNSGIGQGKSNTIGLSTYSSIGNGKAITIGKNSKYGFIGNGYNNNMFGGCQQSILNGCSNLASGSISSTIVGGSNNSIYDSNSIIGGGRKNISKGSTFGYNVLGGGFINCMDDANYSSILGGASNYIGKYSVDSSIVGGRNNSIVGYTSAHIIGTNINAYASNATFVENLYVAGNLSKVTGTFRIPYPGKNTLDIVHSLVETNTAGDNIYRYRYTTPGKGSQPIEVFIQLPIYFTEINDMEGENGDRPQVWVSPEGPFNFFNANAYIGYSKIYAGWGVILNFEPNQMINRQDVWAVANTFNVLVIGTRSDKMAQQNWRGDVVTINAAKQIQESDRGML